jgi:hypothetical protein
MSHPIFRPALLALLLGSGIHCSHKSSPGPISTGATFTGALVINALCDNFTIQVLSGPIDSIKLVKSWKNPNNDSVYTNVFSVLNRCSFGLNGLAQGDLFTFTIPSVPPVETCAVCEIYYPTPPVSNPVILVSKLDR